MNRCTEELGQLVRERLRNLQPQTMERLFEEANQPDSSTDRVEEIVGLLAKCSVVQSLPVAMHHFYRARAWDAKIDYPGFLADCLEPPAEHTSRGRCNAPKKPVLYVSAHPNALLAECRLQEGSFCLILQFDRELKTVDLSCRALGLDSELLFGQDSRMLEGIEWIREMLGDTFHIHKNLEARLHQEFVRDDDSAGTTYRLTSALCSHYFNGDDSLDAIFYPSIASRGLANNLAIRSGRYRRAYKATKVLLCEVLPQEAFRVIESAAVLSNRRLEWGARLALDLPVPVGVRRIAPDDRRIYIAPWRT